MKVDFLRDKDPVRIVLMILLALSLAFNYILYSDNSYMNEQFQLMKHEFIEDVVGYNYCDKD
jgi:hypothetical protein